MARSVVYLFVLLLSANIIHDGWSRTFTMDSITTESENCLCECGQSACDLVEFVKDLDKRLSVATNEIVKLVTLHNTFIAAQRKNAMEHKEIRNLISKVTKQQNSNNSPTFEALIHQPENTMADEAGQMTKNFTTLIEEVNGKFKEVKTLSSDVTELQQENKVLKEEMEKEKRVRRSLQHQMYFVEEGLNHTQSWVLEINEKVNEKDSTNSTIDEVAEIVFAKIAEFDALNKTAIENQLRKLEYTVKDVFRNESQLVQRLDSVANVSAYTASILLQNGTLVDKVHDISSAMLVLEKIQTQQSEAISELGQHVNVVNDSLVQKLKEVEHAISTVHSSTNETMVSFGNELSKLSDAWHNISISTDDAFSKINTTKDTGVFLKTTYLEALGNASSLQEEIEKNQIMLQELTRRSDVLTDIKIILNRTADKDEFYELWKNVTEQNRVLEEKSSKYFSNLSEIINSTDGKMTSLENKYAVENDLTAQHLNDLSVRQQEAQEKTENFSTEFENFKWNQSITLSLLETRMENFSLKVNEIDELSLKIISVDQDVNVMRDLQSLSEHVVSRRLEDMEELLMKRINDNQEETVQLINKVEASINSSRQGDKTLPEEYESVSSRLRIHVELNSTEATTTEYRVPCLYDPLMNSDELQAAYLREAIYEKLSEDTVILHGEQILFSCKKIGRFVLVGSETLTCINGQWSDDIPRCQKLLDEGDIRGAIQQDPCLEPRGQFPYPSDCTKYFDCWDDHKVWKKCPNGLHFNANQKRCDYPSTANCNIHHTKGKLENLVNMIPPIDFAPLGTDMTDSLLATSVTGELVVYPGVTLNLLCLYPRALGEPQWEIKEKVSHPHIPAWDTRGIAGLTDAYKLKLTITRATEDNSGNYTCASPSGQRRHTIRVLVKAIKCPDIVIDPSSHLSVSYRLHPEGLQKVMTTRVSFYCSHGYSLNGSDTATCKASGTWSHDLPNCNQREIFGCVEPDLDNRPGLFVDPDKSTYGVGEKVYYRCQNLLKLTGVTTTRCTKDGTWTAKNPPFCIGGK